MRYRHKSDDSELAVTIETILQGDREVARLTRRILAAQRRLRKLCSPEAWQAYLAVEELVNLRFGRACMLLDGRDRPAR